MKPSSFPIKFSTSILAVCFLLLFSNCYLWKQGTRLLSYTASSVPIKKMEKDPKTPDSLRHFFSLVNEITAYAADSIGLAKNSNFTKFVSIRKPYLIDLVAAAGKTDFVPYQWCYPLFGCWPLRGYFDSTDAIREAQRLKKLGLDVCLGRAEAFSTLGFLSDPIYSFMKRYSVYRIANLIIHEQTHATVYVKDHVDFNEELATFTGNEGALAFIRSKFGDSSTQFQNAVKESKDVSTYYRSVQSLYRALSAVYSSTVSLQEKLQKKAGVIAAFKDSIGRNYDAMFLTQDYRGIDKLDINNAFISLDMTYALDLDLFYKLYEEEDKDLRKTVAAVKLLSKKKGDCKKNLEGFLSHK
ncbi:MAG TPA: aminopeptidase [Chitinivibrionales bacterium]|nr:aminopeptidase [Chitinivibrionales bacterium]